MKVNRDNLLPIGERKIDDRMNYLDAGIAKQDIDRAELADDGCKGRLNRFFAGNIHLDGDRGCFSGLDFASNGFRSPQIQVSDRNVRTFSGKCFRNRFSDPRRRAGHNGRFSV
jgi:hypothetical protein